MKKAIGFVRISSVKQEGNGSFEVQQRAIRRYAEQNDYELIELEPVIESATCAEVDRVKFREALQLMDEYNADTLIVYSLDRFFRNTEEGLRCARVHFAEKNRNLVSVLQGGIDLSTPFGRFMLTQFLAVAEFESGNNKVRFQNGIKAKRERGGYGGGKTPFGWLPDGNGGLREEPREQAVRRRIFELSEAGLEPVQIARQINAEGLKTRPSVGNPDGCTFDKRAVRSILMRRELQAV